MGSDVFFCMYVTLTILATLWAVAMLASRSPLSMKASTDVAMVVGVWALWMLGMAALQITVGLIGAAQ